MKVKKQKSTRVLKYLIEYLMLSLEELTSMQTKSQFSEGEITAYVECLEVVSSWTSYKKFGIENIEQRFPIE